MEKQSLKHGMLLLLSIFIIQSLFVRSGSQKLNGQAAIEILTTQNDTIPKQQYQSWSLFLISNPEWVLPESNENLTDLYDRFKAFGNAIGPDHLAVWFWTQQPSGEEIFPYIDVLRSSAFCSQLKLPPSRSPYILVSTDYPGAGTLSKYPESFFELTNYSVIELNGLAADEITDLLTTLADRILLEEIISTDPESENFWRRWQQSFEYVRDNMVGLAKKLKMSIKTTFFTFEYDPDA